MSLRDDITEALKGNPDVDLHFVSPHRYEEILHQIAERFLEHGVKNLEKVWLWEVFRNQTYSGHHPDDIFEQLGYRLLPQGRYWFLASDEHGKYWVAEASGAGIIETIRGMYGFEYYIIDRRMTWMLCENHHNMLIEAKARE